jgi:hypothetical protein
MHFKVGSNGKKQLKRRVGDRARRRGKHYIKTGMGLEAQYHRT